MRYRYTSPPCRRDCPNRALACHDSCEAYKAWKKWHDEQREAIKADRKNGEEVMRRRRYYYKK